MYTVCINLMMQQTNVPSNAMIKRSRNIADCITYKCVSAKNQLCLAERNEEKIINDQTFIYIVQST